MYKNLTIFSLSIIIGTLVASMFLNTYLYNQLKKDRDACVHFTVSALTECKHSCVSCIEQFAHQYKNKRKEIDIRVGDDMVYLPTDQTDQAQNIGNRFE